MSLARKMHTVTVRSYAGTLDGYGQPRQDSPTTKTVDMAIFLGGQYNVNRPAELNVDAVGLSLDASLTDANEIVDGSVVYRIKKVIPSGRFTQYHLEVMK